MNELLSKVMKRAWEIKKEEDRKMRNVYYTHRLSLPLKKEDVADFGCCLKMAWEEVKKEEFEKKLTLDDIKKIAAKKAKDIGFDDYNTNDWKVEKYDRTYIELVSYRGHKRTVKKCGYWDNNANRYIAEDRYSVVLDLLA